VIAGGDITDSVIADSVKAIAYSAVTDIQAWVRSSLIFFTDEVIADKVISDKVIMDKAITDKAITDKAITDKAITDKVISPSLTRPSLTRPSLVCSTDKQDGFRSGLSRPECGGGGGG
jgi:hypothetical protein